MPTELPADFGKRKPVTPTPRPPAKRSNQVALLLMGTLAVGGSAYALMPREDCVRSPSEAAPSLLPGNSTECQQQGSSSGGGHGSGGGGSRRSGSGPSDGSGHVTRGGFGSFAHAFGFSGG